MRSSLLVSAAAILLLPSQLLAADLPSPREISISAAPSPTLSPFYVRVGISGAFFETNLKASIAGVAQPTGNANIDPVLASYVEGGYFLTPHIAVSVSAGYPPTVTTKGTGSFAPAGVLYKAVVGVPTLTAHYHFDFGRLHPYIGGGVAYAIIFHNSAGTIQSPSLRNNFAPVLAGGADVDVTEHVSLFFDVKKVWLTDYFTGTYAPAPGLVLPVTAHIRTDPLITTVGLGYRF